MDVNRILQELRQERALLDDAIAKLECLAGKKRGRGRPKNSERGPVVELPKNSSGDTPVN